MGVSEIITERLKLQPVALGDVDSLHAMSSDPEMRRYLFAGHSIPREQVESMVATSDTMFASRGVGYFALRARDEDNLIGFCGFRMFQGVEEIKAKIQDDIPDVELRYGILADFRGEGLVNEAVNAVLHHAFVECGVDKVIAMTETPNQPAVNVLQRLGMSFLGRQEWQGLDRVFYTLTRDEHEEFHSDADD